MNYDDLLKEITQLLNNEAQMYIMTQKCRIVRLKSKSDDKTTSQKSQVLHTNACVFKHMTHLHVMCIMKRQ